MAFQRAGVFVCSDRNRLGLESHVQDGLVAWSVRLRYHKKSSYGIVRSTTGGGVGQWRGSSLGTQAFGPLGPPAKRLARLHSTHLTAAWLCQCVFSLAHHAGEPVLGVANFLCIAGAWVLGATNFPCIALA